MYLYIIEVFYLPTDAQKNCFKRNIKIYLQPLLHVSVQSPSSGSVLFEIAKVTVVKIYEYMQPYYRINHTDVF